MTISRRNFLKLSGAAAAGALLAEARPVQAAVRADKAETSASMLYDGIKCVGCRACQVACKVRSKLVPESDVTGTYEAPSDLSAKTWTLIQLYNGQDKHSFVKKQCMHCIEPACVAACPVAALQKTETGPVVYHAERCIGCRFCMNACPFGVPKTEWDKALPYIKKCDFCADRQTKGEQPACSAACPTGALIYGTRKEMLGAAYARMSANKAYVQHIYGENEAGGTSMLYVAGVGFGALGFPALSDQALPEITWPYMQAVPWLILGMASLSTAIYLRTHRNIAHEEKKEA
jgi:formate dehydrogenase iron-sulfur subunit